MVASARPDDYLKTKPFTARVAYSVRKQETIPTDAPIPICYAMTLKVIEVHRLHDPKEVCLRFLCLPSFDTVLFKFNCKWRDENACIT